MSRLERYIAERASADIALRYVSRMIDEVEKLTSFADRYRLRPELGPDLRALPFDGSYRIAYRTTEGAVTIVALFGPGQRLTPIQDLP